MLRDFTVGQKSQLAFSSPAIPLVVPGAEIFSSTRTVEIITTNFKCFSLSADKIRRNV